MTDIDTWKSSLPAAAQAIDVLRHELKNAQAEHAKLLAEKESLTRTMSRNLRVAEAKLALAEAKAQYIAAQSVLDKESN